MCRYKLCTNVSLSCFRWHGHQCEIKSSHDTILRKVKGKKFEKVSAQERKTEADNISTYLIETGYNLHVMWECEWNQMKTESLEIQEFLASRPQLHKARKMTQASVIKAIEEEKIFGMVECDIECPEHIKPLFEEFQPIFRNTDVSLDQVGAHMAQYAKEFVKKPRRMLISSFKGMFIHNQYELTNNSRF